MSLRDKLHQIIHPVYSKSEKHKVHMKIQRGIMLTLVKNNKCRWDLEPDFPEFDLENLPEQLYLLGYKQGDIFLFKGE